MLDWLLNTAHAAANDIAERTRDPFAYPIISYLWVLTWAMAGGFVNFYQKVQRGAARWLNISELIGEITTSAVVGVITFWLCEYAEVHKLLEAAMIAVAGHMGTRAIFVFEQVAKNVVEKRLGLKLEDPEATRPGGEPPAGPGSRP